jgi:hypothetical protein
VAHQPISGGTFAARMLVIALAATLATALANPAIPVLAVGLALALIEIVRGRLQWREVLRAVGPIVLMPREHEVAIRPHHVTGGARR